MGELDGKLDAIADLRQRCRSLEEGLYGARVAIDAIDRRLARARREQSVVQPDQDGEALRRKQGLATADARLAELRERLRPIDEWLAGVAAQRGLVEYLQKRQAAVRQGASAAGERLAELQQEGPLPGDALAHVRAEIEKLAAARRDLDAALHDALATREALDQQKRPREQEREALRGELERTRTERLNLHADLVEASRPAFEDPVQLEAERKQLLANAQGLGADLIKDAGSLHQAIVGIYVDPHPRQALAQVDDRTPFLLLPVRIETVFTAAGQPPELLVRVYPDEIATHTHEATLRGNEVDAGELYWTEMVVAEHLRDERERRRRAAWRGLVDLLGGNRAAWVAMQTQPSDWDALASDGTVRNLLDFLSSADASFFDDLSASPLSAAARAGLRDVLARGDADGFIRLAEPESWGERINAVVRTQILGFPEQPLTKIDAWTCAPRTRVMPDRFVLLLHARGNPKPREIPGAPIADTLFVGPDPLDAKAAFAQRDGVLSFAGAFDWMADFDKAVEQGMGFRVPLSEAEARDGFARVSVLGVKLSTTAAASATLLEELIGNHQFSPKGFSLVRQGTPTNNTERSGTGYSDNDPYDDRAFFTATDPPAFDPNDPDPRKSHTDGRRLAEALGIGFASLQTVRNADSVDGLEATAMSTALFPATVGYWLKTWMVPVVTADAARLTRGFFTRYVTGRGPLAAVRVGNQPYGVLVTSALPLWKYPKRGDDRIVLSRFDEETPFLVRLHELLSRLEKTWTRIAEKLPYVGKPGSDSADVLMDLLGLHPTSVELFQRIGFSSEYLKNLDNFQSGGRYANELASLLLSMPASVRLYLRNLGFEEDIGTVGKMRSLKVLWQHYVTSLDPANLIEGKPPSETEALGVNYIDFIAKATTSDAIIREQFPQRPPTTLLYAMLRNAVLLQLHHGAYEWLKERSVFEPVLDRALLATTLPGVHASMPSISKLELMATSVGAVEPGHVLRSASVADLLWRGSEPAFEAAFVAEQRSALPILASATTAALERAFVEHLDCCQYRLDAWETALFAHRLDQQRRAGSDDRGTGIHLGAYGWVENVIPGRQVPLSPDALPASLRPKDGMILEEDDVALGGGMVGSKRGGFVHAPSLNHASAAALLRNAYLSHADPARAEIFSVNLSSERVRRAQFVLQGMRNGQPIEALLGYQFERGLHERTSASAARGDVPVLELNQFILPYRRAFPFQSREIPQAGTGAATETLPPYNVVNGLSLAQATLSAANGFGLAAVLPATERPSATQGAAILAELDGVRDTLDAAKDLLTAENAYQLVLGNFDRVAAVSLAQKEAHIPPELQVLDTPRGSQFTFTNRVTLHFDDLDPALDASNPWPAVPLTPRAWVEPGINFWLGTLLGTAPERISCAASRITRDADGRETADPPQPVTLASLRVQPVDFVWMAGLTLDGTGGATELEARIADAYRRAHGIAGNAIVRIDFNPSVQEDERSFAEVFPLARHLRTLIAQSRALCGRDFLPAAGGKATAVPIDKTNPGGQDVADLRARVGSTLARLTALADRLDGPAAPTVVLTLVHDRDNSADDETFSGTLAAAFTKLEQEHLAFTDLTMVTVSVSVGDADGVQRALRSIADHGLGEAFSAEPDLTDVAARARVLARAHRIARRLRRAGTSDGILDRAQALVNESKADKSIADQVALLLQAGRLAFSETFALLPAFRCANELDLALADGSRTQLLAHASTAAGITPALVVDEWLQGLARVRPALHRWELVRVLSEALGDTTIEVRPAQVPYRAQDSWLAVPFPGLDPIQDPDPDPTAPPRPFGITRDTLSIAAHGAAAFQLGAAQRGVLLDEWTEEIPTEQEITGIGFRYNQPNAAPPQALLLVVTPEQTGSWSWDALLGTLDDTLARAKRRAVEPAQLEKEGLTWNALAPGLVSEFSTEPQSDPSLDLMTMVHYVPLIDFYRTRIDR